MSACNIVDLPEPVLPAVSTCCDVPLPSFRCCSLVAPARPRGMSTPLLLSKRPVLVGLGGDELEGHLDAVGVACGVADLVQDLREPRRVRGAVERKRIPAEIRLAPLEAAFLPDHLDARVFELLERETRGQPELGVEHDQRVNAAPRTAVDDADQPPQGRVVEIGREVGDDQDPERLGDLAGHGVVFLDRLELVAQVLLDHVLHVLGEIGQSLLDVLALRSRCGS